MTEQAPTIEAIQRAMKWDACLQCGEKLTKFRSSLLSPMEAMQFRTDRPQSHTDCLRAIVAARGEGSGLVILWTTKERAIPQRSAAGSSVASFALGPPVAVEWWMDGRTAYREEAVMALKAITLPLIEACQEDSHAFAELGRRMAALRFTLPQRSGPGVSACLDCHKQTNNPEILGCTKEECPLLTMEESNGTTV